MFPPGRRARDCSRNRFDVYPGCLSLGRSVSLSRSVIQKLKYRLINGGSSFANSLSLSLSLSLELRHTRRISCAMHLRKGMVSSCGNQVHENERSLAFGLWDADPIRPAIKIVACAVLTCHPCTELFRVRNKCTINLRGPRDAR